MNTGLQNGNDIASSIRRRKQQLHHGLVVPASFEGILNNPDPQVVRKYGDRAIAREIDQILSILRSKESGDSSFDLSLYGNTSATYEFNKTQATKFHSTVTKRQLGQAIIYTATIRSLNWSNLKGEILNTVTQKTATVWFSDPEDFKEVIPFFEKKEELSFIACPLIEYGAFDPQAGDLHYIGLA